MTRQQLQMEQHQHWHLTETSLFAVSQPVVHQHQIDYRSGQGKVRLGETTIAK